MKAVPSVKVPWPLPARSVPRSFCWHHLWVKKMPSVLPACCAAPRAASRIPRAAGVGSHPRRRPRGKNGKVMSLMIADGYLMIMLSFVKFCYIVEP